LRPIQRSLFAEETDEGVRNDKTSSTFIDNMRLPVHRWFRYSAGFSAEWVESVVRERAAGKSIRVLDPFAGSGTTILAAQDAGAESIGIEAHPFVFRVASDRRGCLGGHS
jgi:DNA modification methylase